MDKMKFCIICKDVVDGRYIIRVKDTESGVLIKNYLCTSCFNTMFRSHGNEGFFKLSRLYAWLKKGKKDVKRY